MKIVLFQSCGPCWVFQMCWPIECSTFTAPSFRIWKSSDGILSPPLALFIVVLSKAHMTLHSRIAASRWVITPSWLSGSLRSFLYSSFLYSYHLFLIIFASVRSYCFCPLSCPSLHEVSLDISSFLEEISSLSILLCSSTSLHCSCKKAFLSLLAILWNSAFSWVFLSLSPLLFASFLSSAPQEGGVKPPQTTTLSSYILFLGDDFGHCLLFSVKTLHP